MGGPVTAKREHQGNPLVLGYLENISSKAFAEYPQQITDFIGQKHGIYALYSGDSLYYVGLATNLKRRIKQHLKDKHAGKWTRFNLYLVRKQEHIKELESLILRIADPKGNAAKGRLPGADNLVKKLRRKMKEEQDRSIGLLLGTTGKRKKSKPAVTPTVPKEASPKKEKAPALAPYVTKRFQIRRVYKGDDYKASVRADGSIQYQGEIFLSPSWAGRAVAGRNVNGWKFWRYKNAAGKWVPLDELRGL